MSTGYRRPLELNDIWLVNPDRSIDKMADTFTASFAKRISNGSKRPLLGALHETFKKDFWIGGVALFTATIAQVMAPFTLRFLIDFVQEAYIAGLKAGPAPKVSDPVGPPLSRGLGIVFIILGIQVLNSLGTNQFIYHGFICGGQIRGTLIAAIFEKTMRLSGRAKAGGKISEGEKQAFARQHFNGSDAQGGVKLPEQDDKKKPKKEKKVKKGEEEQGWSNGRITSLMSTDTNRIDQACGMFHLLWSSPISIFLTLAILLVNITYSAIAGFGLLFIGIPALVFAFKSLAGRRRSINGVTDSRVGLTGEILRDIRFVKYYGWEASFLERLKSIRRQEIRLTQKLLATRNAINAASVSLPIFAAMISFIVYSVSGHELTPSRVFSSLSLFNALRVPFNLLPVVIGQVSDAYTSLKRVQDFLLAEEWKDSVTWDGSARNGIAVENSDFMWEKNAQSESGTDKINGKPAKKEKQSKADKKAKDITKPEMEEKVTKLEVEEPPFSLNNFNFTVGRGELLAVIGSVGSGKSSLLSALAGDMRPTRGRITMSSSRAFCPQYSWIQNTTLQNNILFGKDMDNEWYRRVVDACALQSDLEMLPAGDKTEIGERGINVSGGQKQRLNIARAIYSNSDIILMDDPLSAVDAHVGRHIMENAICGLLGDKCRVLATHQLHVLSRCDRIMWLDGGRVKAFDTFNNLMHTEEFQELMASTANDDEEDDDEKPKEAPKPIEKKAEVKPDAEKIAQAKKGATLMTEEEKGEGSVPWSMYTSYIKASGSIFNAFLPIFLLCAAQTSNTITSLWLSWWTANRYGLSRNTYIIIYVCLGVLQATLMFIFSVCLTILGTRASRTMLDKAMTKTLRAPMAFFDTTPLGRITNRFAKDVETMDNALSDAIRMYLYTLALITSVFVLLIVYFHYFGIALGPMIIVFMVAAAYYRASAREMKRHEATLRSKMFARFGESITGTSSIRAYGVEHHFKRTLRDAIDNMNSAYYLTFSNQRWLSTRLDVVSNLLVVSVGILSVTLRFTVNPAISGVVFSYMLSIVQMIQLLVRQLAEMENSMNAVERIHQYGSELPQEPDPPQAIELDPQWPKNGQVDFNNVQMAYRPGLPLVLKGVDMQVAGGEKIGIVGRTGAGKSSITSALFRLVELTGGSITIDGMDIAKLALHDLRSRLSIIPQDPTLFNGTVRSNLDPFNEHSDIELWSALRQAGLTDASSSDDHSNGSRTTLETTVEEEGMNFSLGQRQLMALARALVRNSKIIVCDEATSSVDQETDRMIQNTIMTSFKGKTLFTIAHRLKTIINYDRICVMDKGQVAELGSPLALWLHGGIFRGMCDRGGIVKDDFLSG